MLPFSWMNTSKRKIRLRYSSNICKSIRRRIRKVRKKYRKKADAMLVVLIDELDALITKK